jgi:predicted aconitase with swiveling domain
LVFKGAAGIGPKVTGKALVARDGFSARYDLDRERGVFSRPTHKLAGQSYVGRILVLDMAKGGVASAWMLHNMVDDKKAPLALLLNRANPVMAQGAAFANLPLIDRFECDITARITTGDLLEVDPQNATVTVIELAPE